MAGEPLYVPILLGLNLDSLSMNPQAIPRVKNLISRSRIKECRAFVKKVLHMPTAQDINDILQKLVLKNFPEEFKFFDPSALTPKGVDYNRKKALLKPEEKTPSFDESGGVRV
jgi:phosphotransferase system enzyme I (PtsI)